MQADRVFEFSDFILAPKERLLLRGGEPVSLTPKAFDILVVLVSRGGHLVRKDDLLHEVWPDRFVEEVNLTVNISALRKALDRDRSGSNMIQTVPTHGYRFVGPVMAREQRWIAMSAMKTRMCTAPIFAAASTGTKDRRLV